MKMFAGKLMRKYKLMIPLECGNMIVILGKRRYAQRGVGAVTHQRELYHLRYWKNPRIELVLGKRQGVEKKKVIHIGKAKLHSSISVR